MLEPYHLNLPIKSSFHDEYLGISKQHNHTSHYENTVLGSWFVCPKILLTGPKSTEFIGNHGGLWYIATKL